MLTGIPGWEELGLALGTGQVPTVWLQAVVLGCRFPRPRKLAGLKKSQELFVPARLCRHLLVTLGMGRNDHLIIFLVQGPAVP